VAWLHGTKRYGVKNMVVFFVITWIVSNSFEALSIHTGFPFGNYHYTIPGPRILEVPLIIMPGYFGMGYMAWTLSHILNGQYSKKIQGIQIFFVPLVASFIMVMWDIVMDPIAATINKVWIWQNGGAYFGVPISNYFGWFFVVFVFLQIFAIFISRHDTRESANNFNKLFWLEATAVYGIQGLSYLLQSIISSGNKEIYSSMGLISVFTMIFVTILSAISISNSTEFNYINKQTNSIQKKVSV
jgi:putative membrane protein